MIQTGFGNETCRCKSSTEVHRTLRWTLLWPLTLRIRIPSRTSVTRGNWFSVRVNLETCLEAERSWWALIWMRVNWFWVLISNTNALRNGHVFINGPMGSPMTLDIPWTCVQWGPVGSSGVQWAVCSKIWTSRSFSIFLNLSCCVASPNGCTASVSCLLTDTLWASLRPIETSP